MWETLSKDPLFEQPLAQLELSRPEMQELTLKQLRRIYEYGFVDREAVMANPFKVRVVVVASIVHSLSVCASGGWGCLT